MGCAVDRDGRGCDADLLVSGAHVDILAAFAFLLSDLHRVLGAHFGCEGQRARRCCEHDDDGRQEIVTIEPFHGDQLVIYKEIGKGWQPVARKHELYSGFFTGLFFGLNQG